MWPTRPAPGSPTTRRPTRCTGCGTCAAACVSPSRCGC
ncbi:4Fe-4S binding protein [Micromonospora sp. HK10]